MTTFLVALALATAGSSQTIDVTGRWDLVFHTQQGTREASLSVSKEGDKLVGTLSSAQQGEAPAAIDVKDKVVQGSEAIVPRAGSRLITITATVQSQGGPVNIVLSGIVDATTMKGTADLGGGGRIEWTGTRAAQAPPAQQDKPVETMTGTWAFEVQHSAGTSTPTVTITQSGEKLSGKYVGSYGEADLVGSIKGAEFTFTVEIGTEQKVKAVYTGTVSGSLVKGNVTLGELGEGTFTGKRK